jgi:hypothetical protein
LEDGREGRVIQAPKRRRKVWWSGSEKKRYADKKGHVHYEVMIGVYEEE